MMKFNSTVPLVSQVIGKNVALASLIFVSFGFCE